MLQVSDHPCDHVRELLGLQAHVSLEHWPNLRREFEQAPVELISRSNIFPGQQRNAFPQMTDHDRVHVDLSLSCYWMLSLPTFPICRVAEMSLRTSSANRS